MACIPETGDEFIEASLAYSCNVPTGGLKEIFISYKTGNGTVYGWDETWGAVPEIAALYGNSGDPYYLDDTTYSGIASPPANSGFVSVGFNNKDGVSVFTQVKTQEADGSSETVPTIIVEFAVMSPEVQAELMKMSRGGIELVAGIKTAANTCHVVGVDFGLYAGTVDGTSGIARTDKNRYQLTLTGSESELALVVDEAAFDSMMAV